VIEADLTKKIDKMKTTMLFLPPSRESGDVVTPSRSMRGKNHHKHQSIDLEELLATNQERRAEQEILKLD
jgi:hypothetical protein